MNTVVQALAAAHAAATPTIRYLGTSAKNVFAHRYASDGLDDPDAVHSVKQAVTAEITYGKVRSP